jgi:hypothetical protein
MINMKNCMHIGFGMTAGLLALAVASLSGCRKEALTYSGQALVLSANILPDTRTFIDGTSLVEASTGDHLPIFATGTFYGQSGAASELLAEQKFEYSTSDGVYHASPSPVYWPLGGYTDILAYAGPASSAPASNPTVTWPGTYGADKVSFAFTDTKAADIDLVWASANDQHNLSTPVPLVFSHAMARLELDVRVVDLADGRLQLKSMVLESGATDRLQLAGTFSVDNTRNVPVATWSGLSTTSDYGFFTGQQVTFSSTGATSLVGQLDGTARVAHSGADFVPFVRMFAPAQPSKNLVITYSLDGGADITKTVNLALVDWEMGHSYLYQVEFMGDIRLEVSIQAWQTGNTLNMELQ